MDDAADVGKHKDVAASYGPFPMSLEFAGNWNILQPRTFHIRDASNHQRLYTVNAHSGISAKGPLTRQGVNFHNGPTTKANIIAAIGDESLTDAGLLSSNAKSIMMLPPPGPSGDTQLCASTMWPVASPAGDVSFRFSLQMGESLDNTTFEWRKLEKGDRHYANAGGFRLMRLADAKPGSTQCSSSPPATTADDAGEPIAVVTFISMFKTMTHIFSLDFVGGSTPTALGDRCCLAIVVTATRLSILRMKGRTHKTLASV